MALAASDPSHSCLMIESLYMSETFVSSELTRPRKNGTATRAHRRRAISASREIVCVFCHGFATDSPHFAVSKIGRECRTGATTPHHKASAIDRELARRIEPRAPTPEARLRALARLRENDIEVGINVMPVLPAITDGHEALDGLIKAVRANPAWAGYCYTQLTDVEQEINGLMTYDRKPKADAEVFKKILAQYATSARTLTVVPQAAYLSMPATLAPNQAAGVREPGGEWRPGAALDPRRAYRWEGSRNRELALFFYDGPLSRS